MKRKIVLGISFLFGSIILFFVFLFLNRWNYRNDEISLMGKVTTGLFNLNTIKVEGNTKDVKIIWIARDENGKLIHDVIFENGNEVAKIGKAYSHNSLITYINGRKIKTFTFFNPSWKMSYDYMFYIVEDSISLTMEHYKGKIFVTTH